MSGVRCRCPVPVPVAGVRWPVHRCPVAGVRRPVSGVRCPVAGAAESRLSDTSGDDDDDDDDENVYDFSNYECCGLGACALVIEHEHSYGLGMDALVIGHSQT